MSTAESKLQRLRNFNISIHRHDPKLAEESADLGRGAVVESPMGDPVESDIALESIVLRRTRPVLEIKENDTVQIRRSG